MLFTGFKFRLLPLVPLVLAALGFLVALTLLPTEAGAQCYDTPWFSEEGKGAAYCRAGYAVRGIRCRGRYCDNKQLQCCSYQRGRDPYVRFFWSRWFSEERPNEQFNRSAFMAGLACRGGYCDNLRINFLRSPRLKNSGQCRRTPRFSEERPGFQGCNANEFAAGIRCTGGYCDNLELQCCRVQR